MDSQNDGNNSQLPRGLITRRGTQRLPSLRSDSHSSQSLMASNVSTNSLPITTKGGVLKRTFKPTIPVRRTGNEDNSQNQTNDYTNRSNRGKQPKRHSDNNRGKRESRDSKNWIQTEAAVFSGEHNSQLRSSRVKEESYTRSSRSSLSSDSRLKSESKADRNDEKSPEIRMESKAKIIRKLYGDNFIDDDDEHQSSDRQLYPKGWQSVSSHRQSIPSNTEPLNAYNLLKCEKQEKFLLMQIPEEFLKREDGYVGKMRVYKSGRIEMIDSESNIKFDIIFEQNPNLAENVKQENDSKLRQITSNSYEDISEDVISFNGNDLCTLATIGHKQVLLAVPQIPDNI